jgi:predicted alpha/beta-hydrolase family hydrolase
MSAPVPDALPAEVSALDTPHGEGRLHLFPAASPRVTLLASHGAGGGVDARDLAALARELPRGGVSVALLEQPWRVAGRRIATPPRTLDAALVAAAGQVDPGLPLVVGGRSAGARSACRTAAEIGAVACLALSFPLHPPGRPERSRVEELRGAGRPVLVVQGERDTMGRPEEFPDDVPALDLVVVPGGDHAMKVPKRGPITQDEATDLIAGAVAEWIARRGC